MGINIYTTKEVQKIKDSGMIAYETHMYLKDLLEPGINTYDLDKLAQEYIKKCNARPAFLGYQGYPATLCTSLNSVVVHGIPRKQDILKEGDIIGIDLGVEYHGYFSDTAWTWPIGHIREEVKHLLQITQGSLYKAIKQLSPTKKIGCVGECVEKYVLSNNFSVVKSLVGHGIGKKIHEEPAVPNYGSRHSGPVIRSGMVIAIEPMVNMGDEEVVLDEDNWTVHTKDGSLSAHYEHTIAITSKGSVICTLPHDAETDVFQLVGCNVNSLS